MKILGYILLGLTSLLFSIKFQDLSLWSAGLGLAFGLGSFVAFTKSEKPVPVDNSKELQIQENLNKEVQKLQQKLMRAEERCLSYQKLVEVHQSEIQLLAEQKDWLGEQVIEKERRANELFLARTEPDLFDVDKRQIEISHRELKKQFQEKSEALDAARARLFHVENELLSLQKQIEEEAHLPSSSEINLIQQLKLAEEEKKKLELELFSLQQIVSNLSS